MAAQRKRVTKKLFYQIRDDIKEDVFNKTWTNANKIARIHGVGTSTVLKIKRAKTWPRYQEINAAKSHENRTHEKAKADFLEQSESVAPQVERLDEGVSEAYLASEEDKLEEDLKQLFEVHTSDLNRIIEAERESKLRQIELLARNKRHAAWTGFAIFCWSVVVIALLIAYTHWVVFNN